MYNITKIGFKRKDIEVKELENDGYVVEMLPNDWHSKCCPINAFCHESSIIEKINYNEEKYFDFSKDMLDIGSHCGTYSIGLNFNFYHMFDGNPEYCVLANFNMLLHNKFYKCKIYNVLLSDKIEYLEYDGYKALIGTSYNYNYESSENVKTNIIDFYNLKNIGFIKIDVEGMEEKVLKGSINTIKNNNYPPILFELWPIGYKYNEMSKEKSKSLENFLKYLGYNIIWNWGDFETHLAIHK